MLSIVAIYFILSNKMSYLSLFHTCHLMTSNALEAAAPNVSDHLLSAQTVASKKTRHEISRTEQNQIIKITIESVSSSLLWNIFIKQKQNKLYNPQM